MTFRQLRLAIPCALLLTVPATDAFPQSIALASTLSALAASPSACTATAPHAALASEAVADWALARLAWSGAVASSFTGDAVQSSTVHASLVSPEWRGWRVDAAFLRDVNGSCGGRLPAQARAAGVSLGWQQSGISLRYVNRITRRNSPLGAPVDTMAERVLGPTSSGLNLAAWHHVGRALIALSVASRSGWSERRESVLQPATGEDSVSTDSGVIVIPGSGPSYQTQWRRSTLHSFDSELRFAWAGRRLAFDLVGGRTLGGDADAGQGFWGRTETSLAFTRSVAIVGGFVVEGATGWRQLLPRRYATLGLRVTSLPFSRSADDASGAARAAALAFRVQRTENGRVTLGIRSPHARLVEVTGDFLQWRPARMHRVSFDWWELSLPVSRGVYRINVRIDGGRWNAPPGIPRQRDEFDSDAGVLVVP